MTDDERAELARTALLGEADRRIRAAVAAADELESSEVRDKRTQALRIVRVLAEAAELRRAADTLGPAGFIADLDASQTMEPDTLAGMAEPTGVADGLPNGPGSPIMGEGGDIAAEDEPDDEEVDDVIAITTESGP